MKRVNVRSMVAVAIFALLASSATAQPQQRKAPRKGEHQTAEKMAEAATDKLDLRLDLTDAQESVIYDINLRYAQARKAQRPPKSKDDKSQKPDRDAMKAKKQAAQENRKAQMTEIMAQLTDEQKVEYALMISKTNHKTPRHKAAQGKQGKQGKQPRRKSDKK